MIPSSNVPNLMLKEEVATAAREGKFHVWPVRIIDEGIEILTGAPAGKRQEDGSFEGGTVNFLVVKRLHEMAETMGKFIGMGKTPARSK
jgi:predicted ATP-dependent protease